MKKIYTMFFVLAFLMLSGCSILGEVNNSLDYVNETTEYIDELSTFAEDASSLANEAATDPEAKKELESRLTTLEESIQEFNEIEPPSLAEDIHQEIVNKNEQLLEGINAAMQNGEVAIDQLQDSEIFTTINEITDLLNQIEQLGL